MLIGWEESDAEAKAWVSEFMRALSERGWVEGRNIRLSVRWAGDRIDTTTTFSKELVGSNCIPTFFLACLFKGTERDQVLGFLYRPNKNGPEAIRAHLLYRLQ
jgi:hypothetical protein